MEDHLLDDDASSLPPVYADEGERLDPATLSRRPPERADVAVIGAGLTGLSAALALARQGASVAVIEANDVGAGGSGRSFGQVTPYLRTEPAKAERRFGPELGRRLVDAAANGPDYVFGLIETHGIACEAVRTGLIFAAHRTRDMDGLDARARYWRGRGAEVDLLDREATRSLIGGGAYPGALIDRRGGVVNPLALTRGIARAAIASGAAVTARAPAVDVVRGTAGWRVETIAGAVTAKTVLVCTNAYRNRIAGAAMDCVTPVRVHQAASAPLPPDIAARVLPGGQALTDTRRLLSGVRITPSRRLIATIEGPAFSEAGGDASYASGRIARLFPFLGPIRWESRWSGWIDMAVDQYPRIYTVAPGLYAGLGLSGRGLALGPALGRDLARKALGAHDDDLAFPVADPRAHRWFFGARAAIRSEVWRRRLCDRIDEWRDAAGRTRPAGVRAASAG